LNTIIDLLETQILKKNFKNLCSSTARKKKLPRERRKGVCLNSSGILPRDENEDI
jgi:hypothetical protein